MVAFELQVHCVIHQFQNSVFFPSLHLYHSGTILLLSQVSMPSMEELAYLKCKTLILIIWGKRNPKQQSNSIQTVQLP